MSHIYGAFPPSSSYCSLLNGTTYYVNIMFSLMKYRIGNSWKISKFTSNVNSSRSAGNNRDTFRPHRFTSKHQPIPNHNQPLCLVAGSLPSVLNCTKDRKPKVCFHHVASLHQILRLRLNRAAGNRVDPTKTFTRTQVFNSKKKSRPTGLQCQRPVSGSCALFAATRNVPPLLERPEAVKSMPSIMRAC